MAVDIILESAQRVATLPQALQGCTRALATTARVRSLTQGNPARHYPGY